MVVVVELGGGFWKVKASGNEGFVRDNDVFGRDSGLRVVKRRWCKWGLTGAFDGAVFVETDIGGDFCNYVFVVVCGRH